MDLKLDRRSPFPIHEQLTAQIRLLIDSGELTPGEPLPTIKTMALELGVNPNTVAGAYRRLEEEGYLRQRKRAGTRVAEAPPSSSRSSLASRLAADVASRASAAGVDSNELLRAVAAQAALCGSRVRLRVAVVAASELEAARLAERTQALLGDDYLCVPRTPQRYDSMEFHLTVVDPGLTERLAVAPRPVDTGLPTHLRYGPEFPAGAD